MLVTVNADLVRSRTVLAAKFSQYCVIKFARNKTYRCVIDVKMSFLDTFAVVALRVGQAEQTLLQEVTGLW